MFTGLHENRKIGIFAIRFGFWVEKILLRIAQWLRKHPFCLLARGASHAGEVKDRITQAKQALFVWHQPSCATRSIPAFTYAQDD